MAPVETPSITSRQFVPRYIYLPQDPDRMRGRRWLQGWLEQAGILQLHACITLDPEAPEGMRILSLQAQTKNLQSGKPELLEAASLLPRKPARFLPEFLLRAMQVWLLEKEPDTRSREVFQKYRRGKPIWNLVWNPADRSRQISISEQRITDYLDDDLFWQNPDCEQNQLLFRTHIRERISNRFNNSSHSTILDLDSDLKSRILKHVLDLLKKTPKSRSPENETCRENFTAPQILLGPERFPDSNTLAVEKHPVRTQIQPEKSKFERALWDEILQDPYLGFLARKADPATGLVVFTSWYPEGPHRILALGIPSIRERRVSHSTVYRHETLEFADQGPPQVLDRLLIEESRAIHETRAELAEHLRKALSRGVRLTPHHRRSLDQVVSYRDPVLPLVWTKNPLRKTVPHVIWNQFSPQDRSFAENLYFPRGENVHESRRRETLKGQFSAAQVSRDGNHFLVLPPLGSRDHARFILQRVLDCDWPVPPEQFRKIANSPETKKILKRLTGKLHRQMQDLILRIHPNQEHFEVCRANPRIDTDTAMRLLKTQPRLLPVARKYPKIFAAFLPGDVQGTNTNPPQADQTEMPHGNPSIATRFRNRFSNLPKDGPFGEEELFALVFHASTPEFRRIPRSRIRRFLTSLPDLKFLVSSPRQKNYYSANSLRIQKFISRDNPLQNQVLSLEPDQIPMCHPEWVWIESHFLQTDWRTTLTQESDYRHSRATRNLLRTDFWRQFISKVRSRAQGRERPDAEHLTKEEFQEFRAEAEQFGRDLSEFSDFARNLINLSHEISSEACKDRNDMPSKEILTETRKKWNEAVSKHVAKIFGFSLKRHRNLVRKWNLHSYFLNAAEAESLAVFREAGRIVEKKDCDWPRALPEDFTMELPGKPGVQVTVREHNTPEELARLGARMSHCIGSYADECLQWRENIHILQIYLEPVDSDGKKIEENQVPELRSGRRSKRNSTNKVTFTLRRKGTHNLEIQLGSCRSYRNRQPDKIYRPVIEEALRRCQKNLARKDFKRDQDSHQRSVNREGFFSGRQGRSHSEIRWWQLRRQWQIAGMIVPGLPAIDPRWNHPGMLPIPDLLQDLPEPEDPREENPGEPG